MNDSEYHNNPLKSKIKTMEDVSTITMPGKECTYFPLKVIKFPKLLEHDLKISHPHQFGTGPIKNIV